MVKETGTPIQLAAAIVRLRLEPDTKYKMTLTECKTRSLTANAYYWTLVHEYAVWSGRSDIYVHNDILEHYGVPEEIDGEPAYMLLPDTDRYRELSYIHLRPTAETRPHKSGKMYRLYRVIRGSHEYDSRQFSRLVDGLIQEIRGSGADIETMTPAELSRLRGYELIGRNLPQQ